MAKKKKGAPEDVYPKTIEVFRKVGDWELRNMEYNAKEPSCFNGNVSIKRYKVTVEIIEEPIEVYQERLEKLWIESDNHHHWAPLENFAASINYKFKGKFGENRKTKH